MFKAFEPFIWAFWAILMLRDREAWKPIETKSLGFRVEG